MTGSEAGQHGLRAPHQGGLSTHHLPDRWRGIFAVEVPLCLLTGLYWTFAPRHFLLAAFGLEAGAGSVLLVRMLAGVLVSLLVWTYGRWLFAGRVELRPFRFLQEGLLLGDVFLVAQGAVALGLPGASQATAWAQIAMASLWGAIRVVFLLRT